MKVPTYCRKCNKPVVAEGDEINPLCDKCLSDLISRKMEALVGLGISSLIQIDDKTAMVKIPPSWELLIDVSPNSGGMVAKSKDGEFDWNNSSSVPNSVKCVIQNVADRYQTALLDMIEWRE